MRHRRESADAENQRSLFSAAWTRCGRIYDVRVDAPTAAGPLSRELGDRYAVLICRHPAAPLRSEICAMPEALPRRQRRNVGGVLRPDIKRKKHERQPDL